MVGMTSIQNGCILSSRKTLRSSLKLLLIFGSSMSVLSVRLLFAGTTSTPSAALVRR